MTDTIASLKHALGSAVTTLIAQPQGVRGPLRGKDFMLDDLTSGADSDGH